MKRMFHAAFAVLFAVILAGCGGGGSAATVSIADILSTRSLDGDITLDNGVLQPPVAASTAGNVQAGFDPGAPPAIPAAETRGFLVFDLAAIPANASIRFASVTVFIDQVNPLGTGQTVFPFFMDLIDTRPAATPPPLVSADFGAPLLIDRTFSFVTGDQGNFVEIEVTTLMQRAQATAQPFFEVRLTPDLAETGIITIHDGLAASTAPLLHVEFF